MPKWFVSEAIEARGGGIESDALGRIEPAAPNAFRWRNEECVVAHVVRTWRTTKDDRGDTYLKRHWFELELIDGRHATIYFDRDVKRGARWWLYTIEE